jgi:hypothetical protein
MVARWKGLSGRPTTQIFLQGFTLAPTVVKHHRACQFDPECFAILLATRSVTVYSEHPGTLHSVATKVLCHGRVCNG